MSINKAILVGNVGKDPDVRYIDNGIPVARFTLATSERGYTMSNGTKVPERSEWHNIVAWRSLAELAEKYIRKGSQLYIEGKITYRSWEDKNGGGTRYTTEIVADTIQLLGRKPQEDNGKPSATTTSSQESDPSTNSRQENGDNDLPF